MDYQNCTPQKVEYKEINIANFLTETDEQLHNECQLANPGENSTTATGTSNSCSVSMCSSEAKFSKDVINFLLTGNQESSEFSHTNFDPVSSCVSKQSISSELDCCGEYPRRFPYKTYGENRACCDGKTYDTTASLECCSDSSSGGQSLQLFACFNN